MTNETAVGLGFFFGQSIKCLADWRIELWSPPVCIEYGWLHRCVDVTWTVSEYEESSSWFAPEVLRGLLRNKGQPGLSRSFRMQFLLQSALLRQATACREWRTSMIRPG